jgi:hypothetical protein
MRISLRGQIPPDHQGKYREFHDLETVKADGMVENPSFHQVLFKEFPRSQNREFKIRNRGTFEKDQGLKGDLQGNVALAGLSAHLVEQYLVSFRSAALHPPLERTSRTLERER